MHFSAGLKSRTRGHKASFIGAPRMEGVFPFIGEYEWTLRERNMGVNKVKMGVRFEHLVGWDLNQIWQGRF